MSSNPNDEYKPSGDAGAEAGTGADTTQDDYKSRTGQSTIPVQSDDAAIEDPIDANTADSDEQLGRFATGLGYWNELTLDVAQDDKDAIDESNIIDSKTRGAGPDGGYQEPGDEEGLPTDDGTSRVSGGPNWVKT